MDFASAVAGCLQRNSLERTIGIVAVSGGPDSITLAHLCAGLLAEGRITRLLFAHVNHQLRGDESGGDEEFVHSLPAVWHSSAEVRSERIDVAAMVKAEHGNLEDIARRERYRWFTELAHAENATWIATGHSADDQAETVLFRLLRGSGVLGLRGMLECRPLTAGISLLRPLLAIRRQALLDYLRDRKINYRVDSSNRDLRFTRNRLRHELLPQLQKEHNPAIVEVLCRLAAQAGELHHEIAGHATTLLTECELPRAGDVLVFSMERLRSASANLTREMFRLVWQREDWPAGDMDFERWHRLVQIVQGTCPAWDFPGRIHVRRAGSVMQIHPKPKGERSEPLG